MGTTPLSKNGREHAQDVAIAQMRVQNEKDHKAIHSILTDLHIATELTNERIRNSRITVFVVWTLFLAGLSGLGWIMNQAAQVISDVHNQVEVVNARQLANTAKGWVWAEKLESQDDDMKDAHERDMDKIERDIKEIRRGLRQKD